MKTFIFAALFLSLAALACSPESKPETSAVQVVDTVAKQLDTLVIDEVPLLSNRSDTIILFIPAEEFNWPLAAFDSLSNIEFENLVPAERIDGRKDSSQAIFGDTSFCFTTARAQFCFTYQDSLQEGILTHEYEGFLPRVNLHVVTRWHEAEIYMGEMSLYDSLTNVSYQPYFHTDGAPEYPLVSPSGDFIAFYANSYRESGLTIGERYLHQGNPMYRLRHTARIKGLIQEIFWTEEESLVVEVNDRRQENGYQDDKMWYKGHFSSF